MRTARGRGLHAGRGSHGHELHRVWLTRKRAERRGVGRAGMGRADGHGSRWAWAARGMSRVRRGLRGRGAWTVRRSMVTRGAWLAQAWAAWGVGHPPGCGARLGCGSRGSRLSEVRVSWGPRLSGSVLSAVGLRREWVATQASLCAFQAFAYDTECAHIALDATRQNVCISAGCVTRQSVCVPRWVLCGRMRTCRAWCRAKAGTRRGR